MSNPRCLALAKVIAILGFMVLLSSTYFLRTEVLKHNEIRFSADEARAKYELEQREKDYPYEKERFEAIQKNQTADFTRLKQRHEVAKQNYQRSHQRNDARLEAAQENYKQQVKHYEKMLTMYQDDYDAYVQAIEDKYRPPQRPEEPTPPTMPDEPAQPQMPAKPRPPKSPEYLKQLSEIDAQFRGQKHHYFLVTSSLNWVAMAGALCLVGGLVYLIMFDLANGRLIYFFTLVLSFVFLIGPSFHSIMTAIVGFLEAPGIY